MDAGASLLDAVEAVSWQSYLGPENYDPSAPPSAFRLLASAQVETDAQTAYDEMLFAIGNNHRGSYYPAARPAVPLLVQAAFNLGRWPRWAAVEVLTDLIISFGPEEGGTEIVDVFCEAVENHTGRAVESADAALKLLNEGCPSRTIHVTFPNTGACWCL